MQTTPDLPIAISQIDGRYFLFSADVVSYLRRAYNICGVLIGSIPQIPQQNVFLGLPLELMPEEAQLLVEKEVAYVVDDARAHEQALRNLTQTRRQDYLASLHQAGEKAAKLQAEFRGQKKDQALKKRGLTPKSDEVESEEALNGAETSLDGDSNGAPDTDPIESLFAQPGTTNHAKSKSNKAPVQTPTTLAITPTTSHHLLPLLTLPPPVTPQKTPPPPPSTTPSLPLLPPSYPLFAYLHSKSYFLSPGLRFGCQYVVYPGDPLRFHSHFLAVDVGWEREIDLMDVVGGGRLGTGVKKGYLLGGQEPGEKGEVRVFSVEWAVM